ncbi:hypothetical protein BDD12DRAFT_801840 [Trichophaea hybrida]|nr:hypothetical protein BDD12DRAFT_801840 [Trichophaea hybrida]
MQTPALQTVAMDPDGRSASVPQPRAPSSPQPRLDINRRLGHLLVEQAGHAALWEVSVPSRYKVDDARDPSGAVRSAQHSNGRHIEYQLLATLQLRFVAKAAFPRNRSCVPGLDSEVFRDRGRLMKHCAVLSAYWPPSVCNVAIPVLVIQTDEVGRLEGEVEAEVLVVSGDVAVLTAMFPPNLDS